MSAIGMPGLRSSTWPKRIPGSDALQSLLRHRRAGARFVEGEDVGLMPVAAWGRTARVTESRAVEAIGRLTSFDFAGEIGHTLQDARGLIHIITDHLQLGGTAQDQERLHSRL